MTTITVTDAEVGTELATDGVLTGIKIVTLAGPYKSYFTIVSQNDDGVEHVLWNFDPSTTPVSAGDTILEKDSMLFKKLIVKNMPAGSTYELTTALPPTLTSLTPNTAVSGDPDFTLSCTGTDFNGKCVIIFGTEDEPTTLVSDTEVTTGVKPSLFAPAVVPVKIKMGNFFTNSVDFTFTEPATGTEEAKEE